MTAINKGTYRLAELASHVGGVVQGDSTTPISSVATLAGAKPHQISFLTNPKYKSQLAETHAGAVIVHDKVKDDVQCAALIVDNPHVAFARIAQLFDTTPAVASNIAQTAIIASSAPLYPNVTIYHDVVIGKRVTIHSQTVVGSSGFGYANDKGVWLPIPQLGSVRIGDDSQIGASTSIDRGALDDTIIGDNVIIDNQVQIGHNCIIGDHSCICGSTGIAGSCNIGKHVIIAGGCGVNGHISICDNVQITGFTMVVQDITSPGVYSSGQPAQTNLDWRKNTVRLQKIGSLFDRVKALEKQV